MSFVDIDNSVDVAVEYTKQAGRANDYEKQIAHFHSEVSEIYKAISRNYGKERELSEFGDALMDFAILMRLRGHTYAELINAMNAKAIILNQRMQENRFGSDGDKK